MLIETGALFLSYIKFGLSMNQIKNKFIKSCEKEVFVSFRTILKDKQTKKFILLN